MSDDSYWWVQVYWRCTHWQLGFIYEEGRPSIGFACVDEDQGVGYTYHAGRGHQRGEPPAGANIIGDLTDKALGELKAEFYKVMKE